MAPEKCQTYLVRFTVQRPTNHGCLCSVVHVQASCHRLTFFYVAKKEHVVNEIRFCGLNLQFEANAIKHKRKLKTHLEISTPQLEWRIHVVACYLCVAIMIGKQWPKMNSCRCRLVIGRTYQCTIKTIWEFLTRTIYLRDKCTGYGPDFSYTFIHKYTIF